MVHLRELGDPPYLDGAAAPGDVRLQQIARLRLDQGAMQFRAVQYLAGADGRLRLHADLREGVHVPPFPANRVFEPQQVEMLDILTDA